MESVAAIASPASDLAISLSLFGFTVEGQHGVYDRLLDLVELAETEGLDNVWLPERHFDDFGGFSPNPAVLGAMVATRTKRLGIRSGSSVLPLHSAVSVAEDWAMVDAASGGRVGLGVAFGWMQRDFVLSDAPHAERRELMNTRIAELERLWRGEAVDLVGHSGERATVQLRPRPISQLRLWQACLQNPDSYYQAGRGGRGVLTNLIMQDLDQLAANIERYQQGRADAGLAPGGHITVLVHAALSQDAASESENLAALERYMFATFASSTEDPGQVDLELWRPRMTAAAQRLRQGLSLVGTESQWETLTENLTQIGVNEVTCLVDFLPYGPAWTDTVQALGRLRTRSRMLQHA